MGFPPHPKGTRSPGLPPVAAVSSFLMTLRSRLEHCVASNMLPLGSSPQTETPVALRPGLSNGAVRWFQDASSTALRFRNKQESAGTDDQALRPSGAMRDLEEPDHRLE